MSRHDGNRPADLSLISESVQDREKRVEQIREHVAGGSYNVPAGAVAAALVSFFSRDFVPDDNGNAGIGEKSC